MYVIEYINDNIIYIYDIHILLKWYLRKNEKQARYWLLTLVILATWQAEISTIRVQG
jgi:hypothetical protein